MPKLTSCNACSGFIPAAATACPHCDVVVAAPPRRSRFGRLSRALFGVAGSGAIAVTLMACYGAGPMYRNNARPQPNQCAPAMDTDSDGVCPPEDCDDKRADVYPGAPDSVGDSVDQNCDGADGVSTKPGATPAPTPAPDPEKTRAVEPTPDPPPPPPG